MCLTVCLCICLIVVGCHESHVALLSAFACLLYVQRLLSLVAPLGLAAVAATAASFMTSFSQTLLLRPMCPLGVFKSFVASQL